MYKAPDELFSHLYRLIKLPLQQESVIADGKPVLFNYFPQLAASLSYALCGDLPTPITLLSPLKTGINQPTIYMKRDDLSGPLQDNGHRLFGGNKIRKLEFLLADALQRRCKTIITFGGIGSNHALATTIYARLWGLDTIVFLEHQPNSTIVRRNLLLFNYYKAQMHFVDSTMLANPDTVQSIVKDSVPYVIPVGGSNNLGMMGFVNAALELKEQLDAQVMPIPDYIYLPLGSMGTFIGLTIGLRMMGIKTKVVGVKITYSVTKELILQRLKEANNFIHSLDKTIPIFDWSLHDIIVRDGFVGQSYGDVTLAALDAIAAVKETQNIQLDPAYTAKAFAALLHDMQTHVLNSTDVVLFWNTFCGDDFSWLANQLDYKTLPSSFQKYFVQEHY